MRQADPRDLAEATESALVVPVTTADPVVGPSRQAFDHSVSWGIPAHVTVLYPFLAPDSITADTLDDVRATMTNLHAFDCTFSRVGWFGEDVAWLAPDTDAPFRKLTDAMRARFPDHPPYRGAFPEVIPHLTIGSTRRADLTALKRAAADIQSVLPISCEIDRMWLVAGRNTPGSWRLVAEFPLPGNESDYA